MKRVYLAARYDRRDELRVYREQLQAIGVEVTSRWLDETGSLSGDMEVGKEDFYKETASVDLEDVRRADTIIFFAEDPLLGWKRGGRHVEFGYALALAKHIIVLGPKENVFHYIPWVHHYTSLEQVIEVQKENAYFGV